MSKASKAYLIKYTTVFVSVVADDKLCSFFILPAKDG